MKYYFILFYLASLLTNTLCHFRCDTYSELTCYPTVRFGFAQYNGYIFRPCIKFYNVKIAQRLVKDDTLRFYGVNESGTETVLLTLPHTYSIAGHPDSPSHTHGISLKSQLNDKQILVTRHQNPILSCREGQNEKLFRILVVYFFNYQQRLIKRNLVKLKKRDNKDLRKNLLNDISHNLSSKGMFHYFSDWLSYSDRSKKIMEEINQKKDRITKTRYNKVVNTLEHLLIESSKVMNDYASVHFNIKPDLSYTIMKGHNRFELEN
jgi:hypothetical protein